MASEVPLKNWVFLFDQNLDAVSLLSMLTMGAHHLYVRMSPWVKDLIAEEKSLMQSHGQASPEELPDLERELFDADTEFMNSGEDLALIDKCGDLVEFISRVLGFLQNGRIRTDPHAVQAAHDWIQRMVQALSDKSPEEDSDSEAKDEDDGTKSVIFFEKHSGNQKRRPSVDSYVSSGHLHLAKQMRFLFNDFSARAAALDELIVELRGLLKTVFGYVLIRQARHATFESADRSRRAMENNEGPPHKRIRSDFSDIRRRMAPHDPQGVTVTSRFLTRARSEGQSPCGRFACRIQRCGRGRAFRMTLSDSAMLAQAQAGENFDKFAEAADHFVREKQHMKSKDAELGGLCFIQSSACALFPVSWCYFIQPSIRPS